MTTNDDERIVDRRASSRLDNDQDKDEAAASAPDDGSDTGAGQAAEDQSADELLAAEREKAETYYKNWQRSAADFINYKRRIEQERGEHARLASAALVINILPVYDDLERAVDTVDAHLAGLNWVQGVIAIQRKFKHLLEAMDVTEIQAEGQAFDPAYHEAVGRQPGPDNQVLHVVQKGYTLGEKVIRPAMVIVGNGEEASAQDG